MMGGSGALEGGYQLKEVRIIQTFRSFTFFLLLFCFAAKGTECVKKKKILK